MNQEKSQRKFFHYKKLEKSKLNPYTTVYDYDVYLFFIYRIQNFSLIQM